MTASGSSAPYAILSLMEQENSTGSCKTKDETEANIALAYKLPALSLCSCVAEESSTDLADCSNLTSEPVGVQISNVMTIDGNGALRKKEKTDCQDVKATIHRSEDVALTGIGVIQPKEE